MSGWGGLSSSPYSTDNSNLAQSQMAGNLTQGASMGYSAPPISSSLGAFSSGVSPSSYNGYPMFSSQVATPYSPSGYVNSNPIDSTPSVIAQQARMGGQQQMPMQSSMMPTAATQNPWNIKSSSPSGSFDYPLGQNSPPPKLNVL